MKIRLEDCFWVCEVSHCDAYIPLGLRMPLMSPLLTVLKACITSLTSGSCVAGEFDVPLRMFYPDGSSPSFRLKIVAQGKV